MIVIALHDTLLRKRRGHSRQSQIYRIQEQADANIRRNSCVISVAYRGFEFS
jgi:hypothetical protein